MEGVCQPVSAIAARMLGCRHRLHAMQGLPRQGVSALPDWPDPMLPKHLAAAESAPPQVWWPAPAVGLRAGLPAQICAREHGPVTRQGTLSAGHACMMMPSGAYSAGGHGRGFAPTRACGQMQSSCLKACISCTVWCCVMLLLLQ